MSWCSKKKKPLWSDRMENWSQIGRLFRGLSGPFLQGFDQSTVSLFFFEIRHLRLLDRFYGVDRVYEFAPLHHKLSQRWPGDFQSKRRKSEDLCANKQRNCDTDGRLRNSCRASCGKAIPRIALSHGACTSHQRLNERVSELRLFPGKICGPGPLG